MQEKRIINLDFGNGLWYTKSNTGKTIFGKECTR